MKKHKAEKQRTANSTYKKLAVQWLNEALCFVSSSVVADSLTLALTQNILNDLSIKTTLNPEKQKEEVLTANNIEVNKFLIYGSGGLVLLLLSTTIYLLVRQRRNDEINT